MHLPKGKATGLGVEIFKILAEEIGIQKKDYEIIPVTFKRMLVETQNAPRRIGVAVARTPDREKLFQWVGPYIDVSIGLIAKKRNDIRIHSVKDLAKYKVGTIYNAAPEQGLINLGIRPEILERSFKPQYNIYKLEHDRVDLIANSVQSTSFIMWQRNINSSDYELVYQIQQLGLHFIFSQDFTQDELATFDQALKNFLKTKAFQELVKIYRIHDIDISQKIMTLKSVK